MAYILLRAFGAKTSYPSTAEKSQAQRGSGSCPGSHISSEKQSWNQKSGFPSNVHWSLCIRYYNWRGKPEWFNYLKGTGQ